MRYRKLTADGDYSFGNGQLDFYRDVPEAVGQAVQTTLLLWLGEWFLDNAAGTPYMEGIFGKHSKALADSTIQDVVLGVQGVVGMQDYDSVIDADNRHFSATFRLDTIYGPTQVTVQNYSNY